MKQKRTMKPVNMVPIYKKYRGYFVALTHDGRKVLGKGHTPQEARREAEEKGFMNPLLTKIPWEYKSYLV